MDNNINVNTVVIVISFLTLLLNFRLQLKKYFEEGEENRIEQIKLMAKIDTQLQNLNYMINEHEKKFIAIEKQLLYIQKTQNKRE